MFGLKYKFFGLGNQLNGITYFYEPLLFIFYESFLTKLKYQAPKGPARYRLFRL